MPRGLKTAARTEFGAVYRSNKIKGRSGAIQRRSVQTYPAGEESQVILTDTGPLVALIDQGEPDHDACVACLPRFIGPMIATWPVYTEAMYLLGEAGGWRAQDALWGMLQQGDVEIVLQGADDYERMRALMHKYRDRPMDLADASLVRVAEEKNLRDIFTLDGNDFSTYRIHGRSAFRLWPQLKSRGQLL